MNRTGISISNDTENLDVPFIHQFISSSYWAKDRTIEEVKTCIQNSFNFGVYINDKQIGYARVVTDYVVFAYILDVFIDEKHRNKGYSKLLMQEILNHPKLKNIQNWKLATKDAHSLYAQFGFTPLVQPENMMEKKR